MHSTPWNPFTPPNCGGPLDQQPQRAAPDASWSLSRDWPAQVSARWADALPETARDFLVGAFGFVPSGLHRTGELS